MTGELGVQSVFWIFLSIPQPECDIQAGVHCDQLACNRGPTERQHNVIAVGPRDLTKAKKFVEEPTGGHHDVKDDGTYEEVYADKVYMLQDQLS